MSAAPARRVLVIGGGVAGCAAAHAAAAAGATTILIEADGHLGGVAVAGGHRTLCGLAPLDAAKPELLEPALTGDWIPAIAMGAPVRQGRVWLWPTGPQVLAQGLRHRLDQAGVEVRLGTWACGLGLPRPGAAAAVAIASVPAAVAFPREAPLEGPRDAPRDAQDQARGSANGPRAGLEASRPHASDWSVVDADAVIDASGGGLLASWLGLPTLAAQQWASCRAEVQIAGMEGRAARLRLLARLQELAGGEAAIAVVPLGGARWQLSLDVAPQTPVALAQERLARAVTGVGGLVLAHCERIAERDQGRPVGTLDLPALFASAERGLCWAAWPREEHTAHGVRWSWPPRDRHGVPPEAVRVASAPSWCWFIGKGMPVTTAAAAALRVTGTGMALGAAVGAWAAGAIRSPYQV